MRWASSLSERPDLGQAAAEAAADIKAALGGAEPDLVLVFASAAHAASYPRVPATFSAFFPRATIAGCSGGGVIGDGREVEAAPALSVTAAVLPGVTVTPLRIASGRPLPPPSDADAWHALIGVPPADRPHFILLPDPFTSEAEELVRGLDAAYPAGRKLGGLASGGEAPGQNALFLDHEFFRTGTVGVALHGNIAVDTIVAQGCRPLGDPLAITECEDNVVYALGGAAPMKVLGEIFGKAGERVQALMRHSLFVGLEMRGGQVAFRDGELLVRNIVGADQESGALAIGAYPREHQVLQFVLRDPEAARADLDEQLGRYARGVVAEPAGRPGPAGALLFSCLGRGQQLFGEPDHDSRRLFEHLGRMPLGGFFCNGEIGQVGGETFLHGYTSCFGVFRPLT